MPRVSRNGIARPHPNGCTQVGTLPCLSYVVLQGRLAVASAATFIGVSVLRYFLRRNIEVISIGFKTYV
jgi:hypothetical protein